MPSWLNLDTVLGLVVSILAAWIARSVSTPKDSERALLLTTLANDAAALVVNLMPGAKWAQLLQAVVQRLAAIPAIPSANLQTVERAATAALVRLGVTQE